MKDKQFCYWLQGLFELGEPNELTANQVDSIKKHLQLVIQNTEDKIEIPFIFWLEGYLEFYSDSRGLDSKRMNVIIERLQRVFKHIIDPSAPDHLQSTFNEIHHNNTKEDGVMRC